MTALKVLSKEKGERAISMENFKKYGVTSAMLGVLCNIQGNRISNFFNGKSSDKPLQKEANERIILIFLFLEEEGGFGRWLDRTLYSKGISLDDVSESTGIDLVSVRLWTTNSPLRACHLEKVLSLLGDTDLPTFRSIVNRHPKRSTSKKATPVTATPAPVISYDSNHDLDKFLALFAGMGLGLLFAAIMFATILVIYV